MAFTVFIVDDDAAILKALSRRLRTKGYDTRSFSSSREFLARHEADMPGCIVLDVSMPDLDGLELQHALSERGIHRPVIFMTGKGDIPTSVHAMKAGAIDFLTKPVDDQSLLAAIRNAEEIDARLRQSRSEVLSLRTRMATLTPREREVLSHVVSGRLNKQIAGDLGTVVQTVKVHRRRAMQKLGARSLLHLVQMMSRLRN
jgi:FixJ family two-component response regulator